jgi:hypothetical protein
MASCAALKTAPPIGSHDAVIQTPGLTKEQIISKSQIWIAKNFRSAKNVIDFVDINEGIITGNAITSAPIVGAGLHDMMYNFTIQAKDGRFKISYSNFMWADGSHPSYINYVNTQNYYIRQFDNLTASLESFLTSKTSQDW